MTAGGELLSRWQSLRQELEADHVMLLATSKYSSDEAVATLVHAGQRDFAESRPQALRDRARMFPHCRWHMIGPLQKNKAKYVARHASMWHSVDIIEVAEAVASQLDNRELPILLQVNISGEKQKHGVSPHDVGKSLHALRQLSGLKVSGLMGMAAKVGDPTPAFQTLRQLRDQYHEGDLNTLSMGMSHDYLAAIREGATIVRLGTALFGRDYSDSMPAK
ncbi:MAG: YggS family pyridoxal phosphate-dependent enzyme [Mariprofundaceae bacterium]